MTKKGSSVQDSSLEARLEALERKWKGQARGLPWTTEGMTYSMCASEVRALLREHRQQEQPPQSEYVKPHDGSVRDDLRCSHATSTVPLTDDNLELCRASPPSGEPRQESHELHDRQNREAPAGTNRRTDEIQPPGVLSTLGTSDHSTESGVVDHLAKESSVAPSLPHGEEAGALTLRALTATNVQRASRWHPGGLAEWSPLEWAGAMAGEAGEACNAAKKLKRIDGNLKNINHEEGRSLTERSAACHQVAKEVADTIIYGVLLVAAVGEDIESVLIDVFNKKSEEYGFPERLALALPERPAPPEEQSVLALFNELEIALYGKAHNTWERGRSERVMAILRKALTAAALPPPAPKEPK